MANEHDDEDNEVEEEEEEEEVPQPKAKRTKVAKKAKKQSSDDDDEDAAPKKGAKKPRKKKDKNAPKGVKSAYTYFGDEHRPALKEQGITFGEVSKKLGAMWREAGEEEKAKYQALADQDKERHRKEMDEYAGGGGKAQASDEE
ncbi:hypothetical protein BASA81_003774 [Batrachochytrium salamandrivorans]|nr:hypothetical protein BASA81_003774 [Batrachochytrium salamandrivorans]